MHTRPIEPQPCRLKQCRLRQCSSRAEAVQVTREERYLPNVCRAGQARRPALEAEREPAVRWHAMLEHLQVAGIRLKALAARSQRREVVLVPVQPLPSGDALCHAKQQVEYLRVLRAP